MDTTATGLEATITPEMLAELDRIKGEEIPVHHVWNEEAGRDTIRHWCDGVGDLNPLYRDEEYAAKTAHSTILAPPTYILSIAMIPRMGLAGIHALHSGARLVFHQPIRVGDRFKVTGGLFDYKIKERSAWAGHTVAVTMFVKYTNQRGELAATAYHTAFRGERRAAAGRKKYADLPIDPISQAELARIIEAMEKEDTDRRGAVTRYWEDVQVGEELTPVVRGPLSVSDMVAWKMGWGSHFLHHMWADKVRFLKYKRHPGTAVLNTLNVPDAPERVHVERDLPKELGFPSFYDYGPNRIAWLGQVVTNWMGDDGFLEEMESQTRLPGFEGDVQWCRGQVTGKNIQDGRGLVEIDLKCVNQRDQVTMPGKAVVRLPLR